ncbi:hypothetical protein Glove_399g49 [Diversispora epigaea]|uniref:PiggyBac transposable element-derived protein domain-containing protein n=1 Tax=Diversispora epigaea TaxID=1348612 RepID=A0A397H0B2_9GLOM|nr:hypothetical protein Glove_399g49 [Diversispora epigaea]
MPHSLYKRKFLSVLKEGCGTIGSYGAVIDKYFVTGVTLTFQQEISPLQEANIILGCFEMYRICSFTEFEIKTIILQYLNKESETIINTMQQLYNGHNFYKSHKFVGKPNKSIALHLINILKHISDISEFTINDLIALVTFEFIELKIIDQFTCSSSEKLCISNKVMKTKETQISKSHIARITPFSSDFELFIHPRQHHRVFVRLPTYLDIGVFKPIDFFFFTTSMLDTIVENTNLYGLLKGTGATGRCWLDFTQKELLIWIALVIYQGLFKLPLLDQYWNETGKFPIHSISRQMPLKRFEQIKKYLHISSPAATIKNYFDKLEPLLSHIQDVLK